MSVAIVKHVLMESANVPTLKRVATFVTIYRLTRIIVEHAIWPVVIISIVIKANAHAKNLDLKYV